MKLLGKKVVAIAQFFPDKGTIWLTELCLYATIQIMKL